MLGSPAIVIADEGSAVASDRVHDHRKIKGMPTGTSHDWVKKTESENSFPRSCVSSVRLNFYKTAQAVDFDSLKSFNKGIDLKYQYNFFVVIPECFYRGSSIAQAFSSHGFHPLVRKRCVHAPLLPIKAFGNGKIHFSWTLLTQKRGNQKNISLNG